MSKNVAVFVDVANIFYAAKAAGIDIDYVTLLKSATAGRDFVRAYAYTGLDPENENQRQFHSFLARNGYKVISKDIRKYGDGRIKANLDIELVVDMMKTARNLDIAVVVSGDGDFAPAIRAVQEQGVRVEVISFRGNTSSDLIEVADLFTDIAQIARVEKSSARSGRRVAAEGDLSMTEVPEKETEGAPRRRRGRRDERFPAVAAVVPAAAASDAGRGQGNLIALPGERLSRRAPGEDIDVAEIIEIADLPELEEASADLGVAGDGTDADLEDGRRRRRRRGGRGRGRGRRADGETSAEGTAAAVGGADEEDEEFEEAAPTQPPHQTFGSVWDSQIGVPSAPASASATGNGVDPEEDEDLDEPEVPEYLLAERRQGGQRSGSPGGRGGVRVPRGRGAYQVALDRERYGNRAPQPTFGGGGGRPDRDRGPARPPDRGPDRGRDRGRGGRPQGGGSRPMDRSPRMDDRPQMSEPRSSEPWSEVPPELEQLLRAELARKTPVSEPRTTAGSAGVGPAMTSEPQPADQAAPAKPVRRPRTTKASTASSSSAKAAAASAATSAGSTDTEPAKPKAAATRARTTKAATKPVTTKSAAAKSATASDAATEDAPSQPKTRRRKTAAASAEEG